MNTLIFAQTIGPIFLAISGLMIANKQAIYATLDDQLNQPEPSLMGSLSPILLGVCILSTAGPIQFTGDYLIYFIAACFIFVGVIQLMFTRCWAQTVKYLGQHIYARLLCYALFLYGCALTYHGFYII